MRRLAGVCLLVVGVAVLSGCAAGRAFSRGEDRARAGDWDAAVSYYRTAIQKDPDKAEYKIALERAMLAASRAHFDAARALEAKDQLDSALLEYRKTTEYDPSNRTAIERVTQLEQIIRDRMEATRPKPAIQAYREQARLAAAPPLLNPSSRAPIKFTFRNASIRDILTFIAGSSGINITYDASFQDKTIPLFDVNAPLEKALDDLLSANGFFYAVQDEHTILVAVDNNQNRLKYERQVIMTIPISYADATEMQQMLTAITRTTTAAIPPIIQANKTQNTITVRATQPVMDVIQKLIATNDKPRAEIVIDVEILEINRTKAKNYGLNLSQYQIGSIFSPEQAPSGAAGAATGAATGDHPFNLNTISQGISTADFYLTVPSAVVKFLETDSQTKLLAKPQLRGSEGQKISYSVGTEEPVVNTTYTPLATGGANVNPLSSYTPRKVGINLDFTARVTDENDIILQVNLENSAKGDDRSLGGGVTAPSFITRNVSGWMRLRDGESHLLAGLLRDDERKTRVGFPGVNDVPVLKDIFGSMDSSTSQTDIVMLMTPRIIRTHEYTAKDLAPIYVGTNQNFGLTGPPPLIASPPEAPEQAPAIAPAVPPQGVPSPTVPQGGPVGTVTTPGVTTLQAPAPQTPMNTPPPTQPAPPASVIVTAPAGDVRVAGGPYSIPVSISSVNRLSTLTVTVNYNPQMLHLRTIQEGTFLRQGGVAAAFTNKNDATLGRIDVTFVRTGDTTGASGSGLLALLLFDAVGTGSSQITASGTGMDPSGVAIPLQFTPATVVVR